MPLLPEFERSFSSYKEGAEEDLGSLLSKLTARVYAQGFGGSRYGFTPQARAITDFGRGVNAKRGEFEMVSGQRSYDSAQSELARKFQEILENKRLGQNQNQFDITTELNKNQFNEQMGLKRRELDIQQKNQDDAMTNALIAGLSQAVGTASGIGIAKWANLG